MSAGSKPLTPQEHFVLEFLRGVQYGTLTVEIQKGVPVRIVRVEESVKVPQTL